MPPKRRTPQRGGQPRNTRPGQRAGAARGRPVAATAARPRFTNRATILLVVFAILVVSYASSMRAYLHQRSQILASKSQIAEDRARIDALKTEKARWNDPAFIEQQARERFGWVLPGQTGYQVLDTNGQPLTGDDKLTDPASIASPTPDPWWVKVRVSVDAVDHPQKLVKPTPATNIGPNSKNDKP